MTRSPARVPDPARPPATARRWYAAAGGAALVAIVLLAVHPTRLFIAAGVLAAAAAGMALATAWLRSRRPSFAYIIDLTAIFAVVLILAVVLLVLLGIINAHPPAHSRAGASPYQLPALAAAAARPAPQGRHMWHAACRLACHPVQLPERSGA